MLQIISGRSGSGKTELIYGKILSDIKNKKDVIFIVPEQSSFQNEKRLLELAGESDFPKVSVLSFSRLCDIITEEYGGLTKKRIDDGGKMVLMSLAIGEVADRLTLYGNRSKKNDLTELMMNVVSEYKMCAITAEDIEKASGQIQNERLREKLRESAMIYSAYTALVDRAYSDPSDDLTRLYETLLEHKFFEGKTVYIDSFNGYSGQEQRVLECIICQAEKITVTVGCEKLKYADSKNSIFAEPNNTFRQIKAMAEKNDIEILPVIYLEEQKRFKAKSLSAIEESIYRYDGFDYEIDDNAVSLYEADDEYEEIEQTARDISALVMDSGYEYRDIAVICRQPENYKSIIESVFPQYNIPYFMSNPQKLEVKPLFKLVLSAFDVIHSSFNTEKLLVFLKTGLASLNEDEIFMLENYAYMWDIKGSRWKKPFTMNPDGNVREVDTETLNEIESIRIKAITPLIEFSNSLSKSQDGAEMAECIYKLLEQMNTAERLKKLIVYFGECNELRAKEEEANLWDMLMDILDKIHTVLKGSYMDSRRFAELFELMIRKNDISDIPQTLDQVTIGTAGNIRVSNPRAVFVIGAVENVFPAVPSASGIFSDSERCELIEAQLPLYESLYEMSLKEKYNVYSALSSPSERLFVSRYKTNSKGENCEPSSIFREISAIIKNVRIRHFYDLFDKDIFRTEKQSLSYCAEIWNDRTVRSDTLKKYFDNSEKYSDIISAIDRAVTDAPYKIYCKENVKRLFGRELHLSASQLETYHKCSFAYFCKYGIKIFPRKKASMDPSLYGTAVHYILEKILSGNGFDSFCSFSDSQLDSAVTQYMNDYIAEIGVDSENGERFMSALEQMKKNIILVLKRLIDEFKNSNFVPSDFELKIGGEDNKIPAYSLQLPTGEKVEVRGIVDRVDTYTKDGEKYIRIIDYKTGEKKFKLSDILYGLNIQMLLYLYAIKKNGTEYYSENGKYNIVTAGVLYMPSTPHSKTGKMNSKAEEESQIKDRKRNFKMNGILIKDKDILNAMENGIQGLFIPAKVKSDGEFQANSDSLVELEKFGKIFSMIDKKVMSMAQSIYNGEIDCVPAKGKEDACKYCDYKSVCGFEDGKKVNTILSLDTDKAMEIIEQESEENG